MEKLDVAIAVNIAFHALQVGLLGYLWQRLKRAERKLHKLNESPFPWMHQPQRSKNGSSQPSHS